MSILLLILLLLFGLVGGDVVADETVAEPAYASPDQYPTPTIDEDPPPLPPTAGEIDAATPEAGLPDEPPAIQQPSLDGSPSAVGGAWSTPGVFTDAASVAAHLDDPAVVIVALTPLDDFSLGHIPGARQIDWKALAITETGDQQVASWRGAVEGMLTDLGIAPTDTVVVYDGGTFYASRLWWVLDQLGHERKVILDGGLPAWEAAGMPVDTGPAPQEVRDPSAPYVGTPDEAAIATIDEVEAALGDPDVLFVDARTPEEFGEGHLPGAVNIPFTDNAVPGSGGAWRSPDELRAMYAAAGVTPDKRVVPYCQTGVRSAATYVTLTALGYPDVSLFTGSWAEWSADPTRPVEV